MTTSQPPFRFRGALAVAALMLPFALMACAAEDTPANSSSSSDSSSSETPPSASQEARTDDEDSAIGGSGSDTSGSADAAGKAELKLESGIFTFELQSCIITNEDVLLHGPGSEISGQDAYLHVDFTQHDGWYGEVRVDLDATTQFSSSDDFWLFSSERSENAIIAAAPHASLFSVVGDFHFGGQGSAVSAAFEVNCG